MAPNWTNEQIIAQLDSGYKWTGQVITYAFPTSAAAMSFDSARSGFRAADSAQQTYLLVALQAWDDLIPQTFQQATAGSDIEVAYSTSMSSAYAYTYMPPDGSVWLTLLASRDPYQDLASPVIGYYSFETIVHEIGHALGLNHMGNYNGGNGSTATPSSYQDSTVFSVMSYFGPNESLGSSQVASADWTAGDGKKYDPQTPMLNDVMAIQAMYGASTTTRTGDTVYGFSCNVTGPVANIYDFSINKNPILTIFDSGGNDTLNLSGWSTPSTIDLNPGGYSSCDGMTSNIAIAYGSVIENAAGGRGADVITGNRADNRLEGGAGPDRLLGGSGNDLLIGGAGSDLIDGGDGNDICVLANTFASYVIGYDAVSKTYRLVDASGYTESVNNVEIFQFSDQTKTAAQLFADTAAPVLLSMSPSDDARDVAVAANLVLYFNETIQAGSGNIVIYYSDGTVAKSIAVTDTSQVSTSGSTLIINPSGDFAGGRAYYVDIVADAIKDRAGNSFAAISGADAFNFSTIAKDVTAPTLLSISPADNATDVAISANMTFSFDEMVVAGSGNIVIYNDNGTVASSISVTDRYQVALSDNTVTVKPSSALAVGASYYVGISAGAIKDKYGNAFAGISGTSAYNFSTIAATSSDDYPWTTATNGMVPIGGPGSDGVIEIAGDKDLFKVSLTAGTTYMFSLATTHPMLANDPYLSLYSPSFSLLASDDNSGGSKNARITYTATTSGTYYLGAADAGAKTGRYALSASIADDYLSATSGIVTVNGTAASGVVDFGSDCDFFRVSLTAGKTYVFDMTTAGSGVDDPYLCLYAPSGSLIVSDDDSGGMNNARITYTAATSGTYYLGATAAGSGTGAYSIKASGEDDYSWSTGTTGAPGTNGKASSGAIESVGDKDLFKVSLTAGSTYIFDLMRSSTIGLTDPYLYLCNSSLSLIEGDDNGGGSDNARIAYTATASGTYYLGAADAGSGTGAYTIKAVSTVDDYPWATSTAGLVSLGGKGSSGVINYDDDDDLFAVSLTAGTAYQFDLTRDGNGLPDPYLSLYKLAGSSLSMLAEDNDSGGSRNSRILYTAATTGTYYLGASDYGTGTGAYKLKASINHAPVGSVAIAGNVLRGETLTASDTLSDADGLGTIAYEWQASGNGVDWSKLSTGNTLVIGDAQVGKLIRVVASYTDGHGMAESVASGEARVAWPRIGTPGNDMLQGTSANDTLDGGAGIDTAVYLGARAAFTLVRNANGTIALTDTTGVEATDMLVNIERIQFSDTKLAFDTDGNAGNAVRLIGAAFGTQYLTSAWNSFKGVVISYFDAGVTMQQLAATIVALPLYAQMAGSNSNRDVAKFIFKNVTGVDATADMANVLAGYMDNGMSQGDFLAAVAGLGSNADHVGLVGMAGTGIEYV